MIIKGGHARAAAEVSLSFDRVVGQCFIEPKGRPGLRRGDLATYGAVGEAKLTASFGIHAASEDSYIAIGAHFNRRIADLALFESYSTPQEVDDACLV